MSKHEKLPRPPPQHMHTLWGLRVLTLMEQPKCITSYISAAHSLLTFSYSCGMTNNIPLHKFSGMKMKGRRLRLSVVLLVYQYSSWTQAAPIKTTFHGCKNGSSNGVAHSCCPQEPLRPILDFQPNHNASGPVRIRKALQCLDGDELSIYQTKLQKAYQLMRALPSDDPRSFYQQYVIHCAYSTGSLTNGDYGIDVHFSWLFLPWHRWYVYFHERILQSLLDDPTFTLHFWNWDNDGSAAGCSKAGNTFPSMYADPGGFLYDPKRNMRAKIASSTVALFLNYTQTESYATKRVDVTSAENSQLMHDIMVVDSTSSRIFFGRSYRAGDSRVKHHIDGYGLLERTGHASVHFWVGGDFKDLATSPKDPVFCAHHANVDRLWKLWHRQGPNRVVPQDTDFLYAEFLFYNENVDLVRVKISDGLDTQALGYDYEELHDAWSYGAENMGISTSQAKSDLR